MEQLPRIATSDLEAISFADGRVVEPLSRRHLWKKLRTTNVIERCFVEVRRRTRPMVCFVNVESADRIIYSIFQRFNLEWKTRTLNLFTQAA